MYAITTIAGKIEDKLLRAAFGEQWVIGATRKCNTELPTCIDDRMLLMPPVGAHYADPFVVQKNGMTFVLFEVFGSGNGKGTIQFATLDSDGQWGTPELALERPYHISYPFVFTWKGEFFMLPETRQNRTIELYRAVEFPSKWELAQVLKSGVDAVDTTLYEQHGTWWMFTAGLGDASARFRQLSLFRSDSPFGPWRPHPKNPVVDDLGCARPAGRLVVVEGQLIRPGQDCRHRYGCAITWNRIDVLTETAYRETCIARLIPKLTDGWLATHTFNRDNEWQVFDAKRLTRHGVKHSRCA